MEWRQEVERFDPRSRARLQAERARREIEQGIASLDWQRCEVEGPRGVQLPGCSKLYVPLGKSGPSEAPYGFVFRLTQHPNGDLAWSMIAYGLRHPRGVPRTRSVYERAHKRLHGRFPD